MARRLGAATEANFSSSGQTELHRLTALRCGGRHFLRCTLLLCFGAGMATRMNICAAHCRVYLSVGLSGLAIIKRKTRKRRSSPPTRMMRCGVPGVERGGAWRETRIQACRLFASPISVGGWAATSLVTLMAQHGAHIARAATTAKARQYGGSGGWGRRAGNRKGRKILLRSETRISTSVESMCSGVGKPISLRGAFGGRHVNRRAAEKYLSLPICLGQADGVLW